MNTSFRTSPSLTVVTLPASNAGGRVGAAKPSDKPTVPEMHFLYELIALNMANKETMQRTLSCMTPEERACLHRIMIKASAISRASK